MSPQMILVAGPYRSGTNDDPVLIANNVAAMTEAALQLFRAGADDMVALAKQNGKAVYRSLEEIPSASQRE